jgi:GTPase SAR1 family protein
MQQHCATMTGSRRRRVHVANLDPAAENFAYEVAFDLRDLISVTDVMEELGLGPNGALIYCMEYLLEHVGWLQDHLEEYDDDEYLILDCPGQLELYTHVPIMKSVVERMRLWGYESSMVGVFCVDATFMGDMSKFISGSLLSLSAMIALELPHINVLTKCDLMDQDEVENMLNVESARQLWDLEEHRQSLGDVYEDEAKQVELTKRRRKRTRLTEAICSLLDDYTMVGFVPLNLNDEDSIDHVLATVDHTIQYGEDLEVRGDTDAHVES